MFYTSAVLMSNEARKRHLNSSTTNVSSLSSSSSSRLHKSSPVTFKKVPRFRSFNQSIASIRILNLLDGIQSLFALISALLWMVQSYPPYDTNLTITWLQFSLTLAFILDLFLRLQVSGLMYIRTRWALFDFITILPILYFMYQLGFYSNGHSSTNGFVTFVTALSEVWSILILARFIRIFKLLRITELRSMKFLFNNALIRGVISLLLTVLMIIVLGGGLIFLIENAFSRGVSMTFQQSLYFMVVTISTVGYGDYSPQTVLGQVAIMGIILFAIIVVPMQTTEFVSTLKDYYKLGLPYTNKSPHVVLVVSGSTTVADLDVLLHEFFQSSPSLMSYDAVILSCGDESHREELLSHVKSTQYWSQVSYIVGSPSSVSDLEKAAVKRAEAVFLLTNANFKDPKEELAADECCLLRAISIKHYCPYVPIIISINSPRNKAHVLWNQLSKFPNIKSVCLNELKLQLLALSATAPGVLGLMTNLLQTYDGKHNLAALFVDPSPAASANEERASSTSSFSAESLKFHPLNLAVWPLSSARAPHIPLPPCLDTSSASLSFSSAVRRWDQEYLIGFGHELFAAELSDSLEGLCYSEVAALLYERLNLIMVAIYRTDLQTGKVRVVVNPGYAVRISIELGDLACVIGQNADHANLAKSVEYANINIRARWQQAREEENRRDELNQLNPSKKGSQLVSTFSNLTTPFSLNEYQKKLPEPREPYTVTKTDVGLSDEIKIPFENGNLLERDQCAPHQNDFLSFSCNDQHFSPIIPVTSLIARSNIKKAKDQRKFDSSSITPIDHNKLLSLFIRDPGGHIDPITGQSKSSGGDHKVEIEKELLEQSKFEDKMKEKSNETDHSDGESKSPNPFDLYTGHIVICGFIDTRIIGFIRRFRLSDERDIVIVIDKLFSKKVEDYLTNEFDRIYLLKMNEKETDNEQDGNDKDRLFLAYTNPCFGHLHKRIGNDSIKNKDQHLHKFNYTPCLKQSAGLDEFSSQDRFVANVLHQSRAHSHSRILTQRSLECYPISEDGNSSPFDTDSMLQQASWYRRSCLHSAHSVIILANPYTDKDERADSKVAADKQVKSDRDGLTLYSAIQAYLQQCRLGRCPTIHPKSIHTLIAIELLYYNNVRLLKHDADATEVYEPSAPKETGLMWLYTYIMKQWQIRDHNIQARREQLVTHLEIKRNQEKYKLFAGLKGSSASGEAQLDSNYPPTNFSKEGLQAKSEDDNKSHRWFNSTRDLSETQQQLSQSKNLHDYALAFYTCDGLMISSKLMDSLIVQAFYHPMVYDTVSALVTGYKHTLPKEEERKLPQKQATTEDKSEGNLTTTSANSFQVDLVLLDMPDKMVGRTFGFLELYLMIEYGWVMLGLYRSRESVTELAKRSRMLTRDLMQNKAELSNEGKDRSNKQEDELKPSIENPDDPAMRSNQQIHSHEAETDIVREADDIDKLDSKAIVPINDSDSLFYVFTNPPPDSILHKTDRLYVLLQRWTDMKIGGKTNGKESKN